MLVLTRKSGEIIEIGNDIEVCILHVQGGQVRIGIKAPRSVVVNRKEIAMRIKAEGQIRPST